MSEREFEHYLILLSRVLNLSPTQRAEIENELRDHMEERLAELLKQGLTHAEAVSIALGEFGDAAGLAADFVSISRSRKRRWIMRATAVSCAALVTVGMAMLTIWPTRPEVVQSLTAQEPASLAGAAAGTGGDADTQAESTIEAHNRATEQKLALPAEAVFDELDLQEVIAFLDHFVDVRFHVKPAARELLQRKITMNLKPVRADMLLDLVLSEVGELGYVVQDGIVVISTEADLQSATDVRVYNCRDLLQLTGFSALGAALETPGGGNSGMAGMGGPSSGSGMGLGGGMVGMAAASGGGGMGPGGMSGSGAAGGMMSGPGGMGSGMGGMGGMAGGGAPPEPPTNEHDARVRRLTHVLTSSIDPASWQTAGGFGTVTEYGGLLVVNHNVRAHRKIENLLKMLREAAPKKG